MEIRVLTRYFLCFVPGNRMHPEQGLPVKFHEVRNTFIVDETEGMNTKTFHHSVTSGNSAVAHQPHNHVGRFRHQGNKIPECVVSTRGLRYFIVGFWLNSMHQIRKFHCILDKENWNVVAYQIKISLVCIEFRGKSTRVACQIGGSAGANYR